MLKTKVMCPELSNDINVIFPAYCFHSNWSNSDFFNEKKNNRKSEKGLGHCW